MSKGHHSRPRKGAGRQRPPARKSAVTAAAIRQKMGTGRARAGIDSYRASMKLKALAGIGAGFLLIWISLKLFSPFTLWPLLAVPTIVAAWFFYEAGALAAAAAAVLLLYRSPLEKTGAIVVAALTFVLLAFLIGWGQRRQKDAHRHVLRSSLTDALTGLYNYGYFMDCLDREICRVDRYGGAVTLVMFDIDHFKLFNDRFGHQAGNEALKAMGQVLRKEKRESDIVARFGGEEFVLMLPDGDDAGIETAGRIRRAISQINVPVGSGAAAQVTVSAGVACYPHGAASKEELLGRVDQLLYASKEKGRDRVSVAAAKKRLAVM